MTIGTDIIAYHTAQAEPDRAVCDLLQREIEAALPEATAKVWHAHPVWFLDDNPIVGYSKLKGGVRLLFWSGQTFEEEGLTAEGKFKAAEARFTTKEGIDLKALRRWLKKSKTVQWDYKNLVKRKGKLERLK
jgi:hypothetical protein